MRTSSFRRCNTVGVSQTGHIDETRPLSRSWILTGPTAPKRCLTTATKTYIRKHVAFRARADKNKTKKKHFGVLFTVNCNLDF